MPEFREQGLHGMSGHEACEAFGLCAAGVTRGQHLLTGESILRKALLPGHLKELGP